MRIFENSLAFARQLDAEDPLKAYRERFHIPVVEGKEAIYFCGNSLGLQPKTVREAVERELLHWEKLAVEGHFTGKQPWLYYHKQFKETLATIVGALPHEVAVMNNLSVNLHLMMVSFYRPTAQCYKILIEAGAFPSDQYAVETQVQFHGFDPANAVIEIAPRPGEHTLRTEDILSVIEENRDSLALVLFGGINYYTGQFFDLQAITQAGQAVGAKVGFDLAHAAGNVLLQLHDWSVDFACWCTYKYLNSSPGGVAGIFVHERYAQDNNLPRFAGWWGYEEKDRFLMQKGFKPMYGADGWQLANGPILLMAAHKASLDIFAEAGIEALRQKSEQLTAYLEFLLTSIPILPEHIQIITPADVNQRGCQLSILIKDNGKQLFEQIGKAGVIGDWREPNAIRLSPVPLYNRFEEVFRCSQILAQSIETLS